MYYFSSKREMQLDWRARLFVGRTNRVSTHTRAQVVENRKHDANSPRDLHRPWAYLPEFPTCPSSIAAAGVLALGSLFPRKKRLSPVRARHGGRCEERVLRIEFGAAIQGPALYGAGALACSMRCGHAPRAFILFGGHCAPAAASSVNRLL